jgi:hypothetical protein
LRRLLWTTLTFFSLGVVVSVVTGWCCEWFCDIRSIDTNLVAQLRRAAFERDAERGAAADDQTWILDAFRAPGVRVVQTSTHAGLVEERLCGWRWRSRATPATAR